MPKRAPSRDRRLQAPRRHDKIPAVSNPFPLLEVLPMRLRAPVPMLRLSAPTILVASLVAGCAGPAAAQTQFIPYFGKNNPHYDRFDWKIYNTDHFEIYYYPEIEKHLARVAG